MPKKSLFAILTAAAALLSSCALLPVEETLPEIPVIREYEKEIVQAKVQRGDLVLGSDVPCSFEILKQEVLAFPMGSIAVEQVYVSPGDPVKKGDLLISLEMGSLTEEIASIELALSKLQLQKEQCIQKRDLEYKRMDVILEDLAVQIAVLQETIFNQTGATELEDLETARTKYEELLKEQFAQQATLETITADYDSQLRELDESIYLQELRVYEKKTEANKRRLVAGTNGTVTYVRNTKEGQKVVKDQHMVVISDWNSACIQIKGDYYAYLPVGTEITVSIVGKKMQAVVIDPAKSGIATADGVEVTYLRPLQPDPSLEDGNTGSVHIIMDQRKDALYVDTKAILTSNGESYVHMLDENGLRVIQKVTTGLVCNEYVEILDGLKEGDLVIIE